MLEGGFCCCFKNLVSGKKYKDILYKATKFSNFFLLVCLESHSTALFSFCNWLIVPNKSRGKKIQARFYQLEIKSTVNNSQNTSNVTADFEESGNISNYLNWFLVH